MLRRIKTYLFLKKLGINHPWKASGDKNFCQFHFLGVDKQPQIWYNRFTVKGRR